MKQIPLLALLYFVIAATSAVGQADELASVSGRVTTLWGEPLETAEVAFFQLEGIQGNSPTEKLIRRVTTDKNGEYQINALPWGQYRVDVGLRGYGQTEVWRFYLWRGAKRILDVGVPMGTYHHITQMQVRGTVKDAANKPIKGATVTFVNLYDSSESQQTRSDAGGRYVLHTMQEGDYSLYASKPAFVIALKTITIRSGDRKTFDFVLAARGKR